LLTCFVRSFQITFNNDLGRYDVEVTTFQMTVLFAWNQRPKDKISYESLKLATELPDAELRRTLWVRGNGFVSNTERFFYRNLLHCVSHLEKWFVFSIECVVYTLWYHCTKTPTQRVKLCNYFVS